MAVSQAEARAAALRIVDGDTLELDGVTVRLHGIDAPEAGQRCATARGRSWDCGKAAIRALTRLTAEGPVVCDDRGADGYGRTLAVCRVGGVDLNARMVETGAAWAFRRYAADYVPEETRARAARLGVFQAETETPWDYRAHRWASAASAGPPGCPIKGNVTKRGRIYHTPWSPWYDRTSVSPKKGERWFCSEAEAVAAGWRAPAWGG